MDYKVPLLLTPQAEGGYTVTSPLLPELVTEGDSLSEALDNVKDALAALLRYTRTWDDDCPKSNYAQRKYNRESIGGLY